ncbi:hypothetical protein [Candidatus Bealeia paramacronuclearis]|uniref:hypothetical protein n=1 Tax=Candidatus Bealeia paramacronuclearis TaxID=1921001 RepID=UPI0030CED4DC
MGRREKPQGPQSLAEAVAASSAPQWRPDQFPTANLTPLKRKYKPFSPLIDLGLTQKKKPLKTTVLGNWHTVVTSRVMPMADI